MNNLHMSSPCGGQLKCPFRKDCQKQWLGEERVAGIIEAESFVCHKDNTKQCAGHMILTGSIAYRLVRGQVQGKDLVFESKQDMIDHHKIK